MLRAVFCTAEALFVMLSVTSCPTASPQPARGPATAPAAAQDKTANRPAKDMAAVRVHAIHNEQLRAIMAGMQAQVVKTWPQEMEPPRDTSRDRRYAEARELAAALASAAGRIPEAIPGVELTADERRLFMASVDRLKASARELQASAASHDYRQMQRTLRSIQTTCNSCHDNFRELAGPIQFGHGGS